MPDRFSVRVSVGSYEIDANGHVNHAVYHQYGEHARTEHLTAAGCSMSRLQEHGLGIVLLETRCGSSANCVTVTLTRRVQAPAVRPVIAGRIRRDRITC